MGVFVNLKRITAMPGGDLDTGLNRQALARLHYIVLGVTQKSTSAGFTAYLRVAEN